MWHHYPKQICVIHGNFQVIINSVENGFFYKKHPAVSGEPAQQMLRALKHEIPPEVTETYDVIVDHKLFTCYNMHFNSQELIT
jgi:hypothetical protein